MAAQAQRVTRSAVRPKFAVAGHELGAARNEQGQQDQDEGALGPHRRRRRSPGSGRGRSGTCQTRTGGTLLLDIPARPSGCPAVFRCPRRRPR